MSKLNTTINKLIIKLKIPSFENLKKELCKKDKNNKPIYHINIKENDDLAIIYYDNVPDTYNKINNIESSCRSYIIEKSTLKPIASQFNKIIYNDDAKKYLKINNIKWENIIIQPCYEGTMMLVYNYNNKWYISTRRCLNSEESNWVKNKSFKDMFEEAIKDKFELNKLNKDYCYHFILVHYRNKNIVSYSNLSNEYKMVYHCLTTKKYTLEEVDYKIENILDVKQIKFNNLNEIYKSLLKISIDDENKKKVSSEGYILRVYKNKPYKSPFTILKLQTPLYQKLMMLKPNNNNVHQNYIELYQKDKLLDFLPYFTNYMNEIIQRISISLKTISKEILDLYHCTRRKNNPQIYNNLTEKYRKVLYGIHGIFIEHKKHDYNSYNKNPYNKQGSKSINVHDVYHYLKSLPPYELRQIYYDRMILMENEHMTFIDSECIYTMTMATLMYGDIQKNKKIKK